MKMFINLSLAFNTIILDILVSKLLDLGLSTLICTWIKNLHRTTCSNWSPSRLCAESIALFPIQKLTCATPSSLPMTRPLISGGEESRHRDEVQSVSVVFSK